jgi:glycosyltransferase involved in cell wall biosynthesis
LVLAHEESDAARVVRRSGCGVVANPDDPAALVALLRDLSQDPELVARMSDRAVAIAKEFTLEKELQRFVQVMEGAA